ncbi:hypothetical protein EV193_102605 [Herbihabitans rhizosphaerae]|uniref:SCO6045-like C-terminal domain-containing protein n=1 Tax=Herbihabitans rhizosphaerae TaxID=1872711 RepID=A0A4Q7L372_9PSEU|nr:hypothetical protein [Herbihabitans rhizosphaerae]RZS43624.1 hypothetical protein EV193_102605 [Herbihabitans rhizosphaerae]
MSREELAEQQAALLRALLAGGEVPPGFDAERLRVEADALLAKRRRVVAMLRPDLPEALGARYRELFDTYGRAHPRHVGTGMRADANAFADWLRERGEISAPPKRSALARLLRRRD